MAAFENLYASSPIWLQHLMVSVKGAQFRFSRASTREMSAKLDELNKSEHWNQVQFEEYQTGELKRICEHAVESVPRYREIKLDGANTVSEILGRFPVLDKQDVRGNESSLVSDRVQLKQCSVTGTSGTTGTPLKIYETQKSFSDRWAYVGRLRSWFNVDPFYPRRAQFTGRDIIPTDECKPGGVYWRRNYPGNALLLSTVHITPATIPDYARTLTEFKPEFIDGYPSALVAMARVCLDRNLSLPTPNGIITSAETLLPDWRADIEKAFHCKVYDQYAASEPSCFWSDCEHGRMHIHPEYGISEILRSDGNEAEPGEEGEVVTTSFLNPAMPLIRYRVGDLAVRSDETTCPCGRNMPIIERVVGRMDDILYLPERGFVGRLDPIFKGVSNIVEAQVIQRSLELIDLLIVPAEGYTQADEDKLLHNLRSKVGSEVRIDVHRLDGIPRGANGKFRTVVSEVRDQYPVEM